MLGLPARRSLGCLLISQSTVTVADQLVSSSDLLFASDLL